MGDFGQRGWNSTKKENPQRGMNERNRNVCIWKEVSYHLGNSYAKHRESLGTGMT